MGKEQISPEIKEFAAAFASAIVSELRKPEPPTEQQQAQMKAAQEERLATSRAILEKKRNDRWFQEKGCKHSHSGPFGGTHAVYVRDNDVPESPGYVICQACQGRFRPDEPKMRRLDPDAIFNTDTFNKLLQDCHSSMGAEILG